MPQFEGVYAAAVTPRRLGMQDINLGVMWDLIDFLCESRIQGIVLLGATGEFVHYSTSERMRMMGLAPKRSRVPVLINVSHSTLDGTVELAQAAAASGAAGVLVMPPYFFRYDEEAIRSYYRSFAEEADISVPILLYNIPQFTSPVSADSIETLLGEGVVHGVKDSSGDEGVFLRLRDARAQQLFTLMIGNDELLLRAGSKGASGVISGVASALPELLLAVDRAAQNGETDNRGAIRQRLAEFLEWTSRVPVPVLIREAVTARGLRLGSHAVPPAGATERTLSDFRSWFRDWLPAVLGECKSD